MGADRKNKCEEKMSRRTYNESCDYSIDDVEQFKLYLKNGVDSHSEPVVFDYEEPSHVRPFQGVLCKGTDTKLQKMCDYLQKSSYSITCNEEDACIEVEPCENTAPSIEEYRDMEKNDYFTALKSHFTRNYHSKPIQKKMNLKCVVPSDALSMGKRYVGYNMEKPNIKGRGVRAKTTHLDRRLVMDPSIMKELGEMMTSGEITQEDARTLIERAKNIDSDGLGGGGVVESEVLPQEAMTIGEEEFVEEKAPTPTPAVAPIVSSLRERTTPATGTKRKLDTSDKIVNWGDDVNSDARPPNDKRPKQQTSSIFDEICEKSEFDIKSTIKPHQRGILRKIGVPPFNSAEHVPSSVDTLQVATKSMARLYQSVKAVQPHPWEDGECKACILLLVKATARRLVQMYDMNDKMTEAQFEADMLDITNLNFNEHNKRKNKELKEVLRQCVSEACTPHCIRRAKPKCLSSSYKMTDDFKVQFV